RETSVTCPSYLVGAEDIKRRIRHNASARIQRRMELWHIIFGTEDEKKGLVFDGNVNLDGNCRTPNLMSTIWGSGLLMAVPKHRRPIEKRLSRKFGCLKYNWKPLVPRTNLIICKSCGHYHEAYTIC
ncbi:hypothetical protein QAD02_002197, partial [Eretmocerus hayati]